MTTCPNCGKVAGLHSSILQGCMCQYSMQAPPQRTWVGLTNEEFDYLRDNNFGLSHLISAVEAKLKENPNDTR